VLGVIATRLVLKYSKASFMMLGWLTEFKGFSATIATELPVKTLNEIEYYCGFERNLRSNSKYARINAEHLRISQTMLGMYERTKM
jgi:hypothetical protein